MKEKRKRKQREVTEKARRMVGVGPISDEQIEKTQGDSRRLQ